MTDARPRFSVIRFIPSYNDRDGIECWYGQRLASTMTEAWAHKLAARLDDGDGWDETYVEVRDGRGCRIFRPRPHDVIGTDECPF